MAGQGAEARRKQLVDLTYAPWKPRVLQIAFRRGVFEKIREAGARATASALASGLGWNTRAAWLFLDALAGSGFLEKKAGVYRVAARAKPYLLPEHEAYLGNLALLGYHGWEAWGNLENALATGAPLAAPAFFENDPGRVRGFILAMRDSAAGHARKLARLVRWRGRKHLIDIGCGPAVFTIEFLKANPKLRATLFDLPLVVPIAREFVARAGLAARAETRPGDFTKDDLGRGYDAAFLSHILHGLSEEGCRALLRKIHAALEPGGELVIQDFFLAPDRTRPEFAALFSLNMLLHAPGGRSYSAAEVTEWLRACGFSAVRGPRLGLPRDISLLVARK